LNVLKILNIILAVLIVSVSIYHFFINELPIFVVFLCLSVYLLLSGYQQATANRKDWIGYLSIGTGIVLLVGVVIELMFRNF